MTDRWRALVTMPCHMTTSPYAKFIVTRAMPSPHTREGRETALEERFAGVVKLLHYCVRYL